MKLAQGTALPQEPVLETRPISPTSTDNSVEMPTDRRFKISEFNY